MRLALFEPDIAQNTGTILRMAACLGVAVDLIEPLGFVFSDRRLKRAGMDYLDRVEIVRHASWEDFRTARAREAGRLVALAARGETRYVDFAYRGDDVLMVGSETSGFPAAVAREAEARLRIPMAAGNRSFNVAVAAAMALGEALRQTATFPREAA